MPDAVIAAAARSPIGRAFKGSMREIRPDDLATEITRAALDQIPQLDPSQIDDLILGCGLPSGEQGHNLARVVAVLLGFDSLPGTTVNRYCASSLQGARMALHAIKAGEGEVFISAGVECLSRFTQITEGTPEVVNGAFGQARERSARLQQPGAEWSDPRSAGELPDVYIAMGQTAENVAQLRNVSRVAQDEFAARSQQLTQTSLAAGFWTREITPVTTPDGNVVDQDDCPRPGTTVDLLSQLPPVFRVDGTVTAGNACPLNDGAASLVIMSDGKANDLAITPLARIVATGLSALSPEIMGLGVVEASKRALARAGMTINDIDLVEINEAFSAQVVPSYLDLGIDLARLNVNGGAIAIGHPFGMTGARMITTLINSLQWHDKQVGMAALCVGGGQGMAMVIERAA